MKLAKESVREGGSSYDNLDLLINDVKRLTTNHAGCQELEDTHMFKG